MMADLSLFYPWNIIYAANNVDFYTNYYNTDLI